jgi:hypothetical protein
MPHLIMSKECSVCLTDNSTIITCSNSHPTCHECFFQHAKSTDKIVDRKVPCPSIGLGCDAMFQDIAFLKYYDNERMNELLLKLYNSKEREAINSLDKKNVIIQTPKTVDEIYEFIMNSFNTTCPKCSIVFDTFDGCTVLSCMNCKTHFCGWCLVNLELSNKSFQPMEFAHKHISFCNANRIRFDVAHGINHENNNNGLYCSEEIYKEHRRNIIIIKINNMIENFCQNNEIKNQIIEKIKPHLIELNIAINDIDYLSPFNISLKNHLKVCIQTKLIQEGLYYGEKQIMAQQRAQSTTRTVTMPQHVHHHNNEMQIEAMRIFQENARERQRIMDERYQNGLCIECGFTKTDPEFEYCILCKCHFNGCDQIQQIKGLCYAHKCQLCHMQIANGKQICNNCICDIDGCDNAKFKGTKCHLHNVLCTVSGCTKNAVRSGGSGHIAYCDNHICIYSNRSTCLNIGQINIFGFKVCNLHFTHMYDIYIAIRKLGMCLQHDHNDMIKLDNLFYEYYTTNCTPILQKEIKNIINDITNHIDNCNTCIKHPALNLQPTKKKQKVKQQNNT